MKKINITKIHINAIKHCKTLSPKILQKIRENLINILEELDEDFLAELSMHFRLHNGENTGQDWFQYAEGDSHTIP